MKKAENVVALIENANKLLRFNQIEEAREIALHLYEHFPNKAAGLQLLCQITHRKHEWNTLLEYAGKLLKTFPSHLLFGTYQKAIALLQMNRLSEAEELKDDLKKQFPAHIESYELAAQLAQKNQAHHEAIQYYDHLIDNYPPRLNWFNAKIQNLMLLKQYDEAKEVTYLMVEKFPNRLTAYLKLQNIALQSGIGIDEMVRLTEDLEDQFSNNILLKVKKGELLLKQEKYIEANALIESLLQAFPQNIYVYQLKMQYHLQRQEWRNVLKVADEVEKNIDHSNESLRLKTLALLHLYQLKDAKKTANDLIDKKPHLPIGHILKIKLIEKRLDYQSALKEWDKILATFPNLPQALKGKAQALVELGKYEQAETIYKQLVEKQADDIVGYQGLGQLYAKTAQWKMALKNWETYLHLSPEEPIAIFQKTICLLQLRQVEQAEYFYLIHYHLLHDFQKAQINTQRKHHQTALKHYENILKKDPQNRYALLGKLTSLLKTNQVKEVDRIFQNLIHNNDENIDFWMQLTDLSQYFKYYEMAIQEKIEPLFFRNPSIEISEKQQNKLKEIGKIGTQTIPPEWILPNNQELDIVYSWLDIHASEYHKKFEQAYGFKAPQTARNNSNEILFSLKTIEKYLSHVRKIFIVIDQQDFDISSLSSDFQDKINFIEQSSLVPDELVNFTIFNQQLLAAFYWKIPDLNECFLQFQPHQFIGRELSQKYLFNEAGMPLALLQPNHYIYDEFLLHKMTYSPNKFYFQSNLNNAINAFEEVYDKQLKLSSFDQVFLMRKQACEKTFRLFENEWKDTFFKAQIPTNQSVHFSCLANWIGMEEGWQVLGDTHFLKRNSSVLPLGLTEESLDYLLDKRPHFFSVHHLHSPKSQSLFKYLTQRYFE